MFSSIQSYLLLFHSGTSPYTIKENQKRSLLLFNHVTKKEPHLTSVDIQPRCDIVGISVRNFFNDAQLN